MGIRAYSVVTVALDEGIDAVNLKWLESQGPFHGQRRAAAPVCSRSDDQTMTTKSGGGTCKQFRIW